MIIRYSFVFTLVSPRRSFESFRTERTTLEPLSSFRNVSILSLSLSFSLVFRNTIARKAQRGKERTDPRAAVRDARGFPQAHSVCLSTKEDEERRGRRRTTTPTTLKARKRSKSNSSKTRDKHQEEERERRARREPNHFVQYASPKTAAPRELPFHDARVERERLRPTFYTSEEDEWKKRQKRTNEYIQKPVVSSNRDGGTFFRAVTTETTRTS